MPATCQIVRKYHVWKAAECSQAVNRVPHCLAGHLRAPSDHLGRARDLGASYIKGSKGLRLKSWIRCIQHRRGLPIVVNLWNRETPRALSMQLYATHTAGWLHGSGTLQRPNFQRLYVSPSPFSWASPPSCLFLRFAKRPNWLFLLLICLFLSLSCPLHPWFCPLPFVSCAQSLEPQPPERGQLPLPPAFSTWRACLWAANKTWDGATPSSSSQHTSRCFAVFQPWRPAVSTAIRRPAKTSASSVRRPSLSRSNDRVTANSLQPRLLTSTWGFKHSWKYVSNLGRWPLRPADS